MLDYRKPFVERMLNTSTLRVKESILAVDDNQTPDEQRQGRTIHRNGKGWRGNPMATNRRHQGDARFGSSLAQQLRNGRSLSEKQLACARNMLPKYWKQLQGVAASWDQTMRQAAVEISDMYKSPEPLLTCPICGASDLDADSRYCGMCGNAMKPAWHAPIEAEIESEINTKPALLPVRLTNKRIMVPFHVMDKYAFRPMYKQIPYLTDKQVVKWLAFEANLLRRKDQGIRVYWDGKGHSDTRRTVEYIY